MWGEQGQLYMKGDDRGLLNLGSRKVITLRFVCEVRWLLPQEGILGARREAGVVLVESPIPEVPLVDGPFLLWARRTRTCRGPSTAWDTRRQAGAQQRSCWEGACVKWGETRSEHKQAEPAQH